MDENAQQERVEQELTEYLDGALSPRRARRLEDRLAADETLRETLGKYAALEGHLAALGDEAPDVDYDAQRRDVLAALERRELLDRPARRPVVLRPWFVASAAAAMVLMALLTGWAVDRWLSPAWSGPVVQVALSGPTRPAEAGTIEVRYPPVRWSEMRLATNEERTASARPAGTVMVSFGREDERVAAAPFPAAYVE